MNSYLNYISFQLGSHRVDNQLLCNDNPNLSPDDILKKNGIKYRYQSEYELVSDFAKDAAEQFLQEFDIDKSSIDYLIVCTECPDYTAPATSCIIQDKLGLSKQTGTLDLSFGCSGYTYGLLQAKALVESEIANNILLITVDHPTKVIRNCDLDLRILFSDAASCCLISSEQKGFKISKFAFGTDGSGERRLTVDNSSFKNHKDENWYLDPQNKGLKVGVMKMDGEAIFRFSLREIPPLIDQVLKKNNLNFNDIDLFIFHQPSKIILESLKKKLNIDDKKFFSSLAQVGNTVSASVPIALKMAHDSGRIKPGMTVLIAGFGIGYSWSATILKTISV